MDSITSQMSLEQRGAAGSISERIERIPFGRWHTRWLAVVGSAHLFDAFDALAIAFVLPLLILEWQLSPAQAGLVISIGYVGQAIGAVLMGRAAERYGRVRVLRWALSTIAVFSLLSSLATSVAVFMVLRFAQGIGLGGEVPVAAVYINELCPARFRGRVVFTLQTLFTGGILLTAVIALWLIPLFGWHVMFVIGGLPILLAVALPYLIPESPRWLAAQGDVGKAGAIVTRVEAEVVRSGTKFIDSVSLPELPVVEGRASLADLLQNGYRSRTISAWVIAWCAAITAYGLLSWMPSLYTTVYKIPVAEALRYALANNVASFVGGLVAIGLIDLIGRRRCFIIGFAAASVPLLYLWFMGASVPLFAVVVLAAISTGAMSFIMGGIYVYAPEIYPTRMRALGTGATSAWLRIGAVMGPLFVGAILPAGGITGVFLLFAGGAVLGAIVVFFFGIETRGRPLEEIAR
jgi:putative MFS transporter